MPFACGSLPLDGALRVAGAIGVISSDTMKGPFTLLEYASCHHLQDQHLHFLRKYARLSVSIIRIQAAYLNTEVEVRQF